MLRDDFTCFLQELLTPPTPITDASNNGLQVEGNGHLSTVAFAVDACDAVFSEAIALGADALVVHHGISWGDGIKYITGQTCRRIAMLIKAGISLYAYHLPLDWHPELGNNAVIARVLGLVHTEEFCRYGGIDIGRWGRLAEPRERDSWAMDVEKVLQTNCRLSGPAGPVSTVGIVSGGGASAVRDCAVLGIDCLLTGEFSHQYVHDALELGVSVVAAGHYRTEVWGVQALMERVSRETDLRCCFIDRPTGY